MKYVYLLLNETISIAAIVATNVAIIQSTKISMEFAEEGLTAALAAMIAAGINVNSDHAALPDFILSFAWIAFLFCGKMQEIVTCHSFFSLTSFHKTLAYANN